ncbi:hypothetical protein PF003_g36276 [Phytophthora fragariae]|nr:hypothetical protein PF003_g36276 [Phytophthora fragariae]
MDFIFGLPRDAEGRTGVLVFVDRFSKMVHLAPVAGKVTADESAELFLDLVFRHHGLPESIASDRDPRFTSVFWKRLFTLLGTRLLMPTATHPETDGKRCAPIASSRTYYVATQRLSPLGASSFRRPRLR